MITVGLSLSKAARRPPSGQVRARSVVTYRALAALAGPNSRPNHDSRTREKTPAYQRTECHLLRHSTTSEQTGWFLDSLTVPGWAFPDNITQRYLLVGIGQVRVLAERKGINAPPQNPSSQRCLRCPGYNETLTELDPYLASNKGEDQEVPPIQGLAQPSDRWDLSMTRASLIGGGYWFSSVRQGLIPRAADRGTVE